MEIDDRLRIATPEGVDVDLVVAGLGSRFIAYLVDFVIQTLLILALALGVSSFGDFGLAAAALGLFVISVLYPVLFEAFDDGRTPGKRVIGLRVVNLDGTRVTFLTSVVRNVLRVIDAIPGTYTVGMVAVFVTARHQRVGDLAAGTVVVLQEKVPIFPSGAPPGQPVTPPWVSSISGSWDVSAVSSEELGAVRSFLERRWELTPAARMQVGTEMATRLAGKVAGVPTEEGPERFLEWIVWVKLNR